MVQAGLVSLLAGRSSANPITSKEIERALGLPGSQIRDMVRELRREGQLIGSASDRHGRKGGYYIIETREEYDDTRQHLVNRLTSLSNTLKRMDAAADVKFRPSGQMSIFEGGA